MGQVREVLRAARESVLDLCGDGRPSVLAEHGLAGALQRAAALGSRAGLAVDVQVAADLGPLPPDVEAATYFCCVEALQNVAKHASATSVSVVVQRVGRELGLSVSDNGVGLPATAADASGGLTGLGARLAAVGGRVHVSAGPRGGTVVRAALPLATPQATTQALDPVTT